VPVITCTLSPQANAYVRSKAQRRADLGRIISECLIAAMTREEVLRERDRERQPLTTKESWRETGLCMD
jgi:hypothetical protein